VEVQHALSTLADAGAIDAGEQVAGAMGERPKQVLRFVKFEPGCENVRGKIISVSWNVNEGMGPVSGSGLAG